MMCCPVVCFAPSWCQDASDISSLCAQMLCLPGCNARATAAVHTHSGVHTVHSAQWIIAEKWSAHSAQCTVCTVERS